MVQNEIGYVISNKNYLVYLDGLPSIKIGDLVANDDGIRGMVNALFDTQVEVLLLEEGTIYPGQVFRQTGERLGIQIGNFLLGRAINPLGVPIDGKGMLTRTKSDQFFELDRPAKGIEAREFITSQLITGITLIDNLVPLGMGQRELVIGDSNAGITDFLIDLIVNQRQNEIVCILAIIGKPASTIKNLINTLSINKALSHTIVVASSSTDNPPLIFTTPHSAFSIAEHFQSLGKDVLIILDDMGNHAKTYREISLLGGRPPGRESYPGDIFYQEAHLMERAGKFNSAHKGGSITALPVIELNLNDFTGFITTTLMSITDGHLLFRSNLYNKNQRPAIDIALSVSRVGRQTQTLVNNLLSRKIRQVLAQAADLETLSRFSAELPEETQLILRRKGLIEEVIKQEDLTYLPLPIQSILLSLVFTNFFKDKNDVYLRKYKNTLIKSFAGDPTLVKVTQQVPKLKSDEELVKLLDQVETRIKEICK